MTLQRSMFIKGLWMSHMVRPNADSLYRIVENVNLKAYAQAIRHLVYVLFDSLLATHRDGKSNLCMLSNDDTDHAP